MGEPVKRLYAIEAARGAAALVVLLYHATEIWALPKYGGSVALGGAFRFGGSGIDFFFVLSGFIIAYVHSGDLGVKNRCGVYAWRRFARIYPTYWVACALTLLAFAAGTAVMPALQQIVSSLVLVPYEGKDPFIGVAWTLQHEMLFYVLFGIAIASPALGAGLFVAWLGGILLATAGVIAPVGLLGFIFRPNNLQFFLGMAGALVVARDWLPRPGLVATLGGLGFLATGLIQDVVDPHGGDYYLTWRMTFGIFALPIVVGLARLELSKRIAIPRIAVFLGAASYAVYLTHQTIMSLLCKVILAARLNAFLGTNGIWLVLVATALALSLLFYLTVDRPLGRILRGAAKRQSARQAHAASALAAQLKRE